VASVLQELWSAGGGGGGGGGGGMSEGRSYGPSLKRARAHTYTKYNSRYTSACVMFIVLHSTSPL